MIRRLFQICNLRISSHIRQIANVTIEPVSEESVKVVDAHIVPNVNDETHKSYSDNVLDKCQEDLSYVAPYLKPSFNFASYVNRSKTLQQFVKLGVNLYKWEKIPDVPSYILQLDFDKDIKNYVTFLTELGLNTEDIGTLIERNPFIFKESFDNLQVRINYLKYKKFADEMILRIVQDNAKWLSYDTKEIDKKLGYFQKTFFLSGNEVRQLAATKPRLITYSMEKIRLNFFVMKEEMGFSSDELKQLLLQKPKLYMKNQANLLKTFEYVHKEMKIPLETIVQMPGVLLCREFRIKQRHQFLEKLGKVQFDPKKPNYISLIALISGSDAHFATEVAGSSVNIFNSFLKTL